MRTRNTRAHFSIAVVSVLAVLGAAVLAQGSDPQIGLWKLNLAKSKYNPGPAPKSATTKIDAAGSGVKITVDQVAADGKPIHWELTANYDGKDSPVTGNPDADMVSRTLVNPNTVETITKKDGKVITMDWTEKSKVTRDKKPVPRTEIKAGANVVVDAHGDGLDDLEVVELRLVPAPAKPTK